MSLVTRTTALLLAATPVLADGSEQLGAPSVSIAANGRAHYVGTGLFTQPNTIDVSLPSGAEVVQVLAYWDGLDAPADSQGATDTILLGGVPVTGDRVGGGTNFYKQYYVSSYRADVTELALVAGGETTLTVEGLDYSYANNGLALVIITDDERTFEVRDGLDYAYSGFGAPYDQTEPVVYTFDPADVAREATLGLIVGGVDAARPSVVEVRVDGALTIEALDLFDSNLGPQMDAHTLELTVPAGATEVSVQLLSEDRGGAFTGNKVASMTWLHSSLSMDAPQLFGAWPKLWLNDWWRWDPWDLSDNATETVVLTDPFNVTFGVGREHTGLRYKHTLWHAARGYGSSWYPLRRKLNREAAAALANADANIGFPYTAEEVKAIYRDAVAAEKGPETIETAFWLFFDANRLGSPW